MKITNLDAVPSAEMNMEGARDVRKQVPISGSDGSPAFAFRVFTIEPEGHTPHHAHPFEHLNYIIDGDGVIVNESGEEQVVKKGDFVLVLPGEKHQYRNKSALRPFVMICAVPKEYEWAGRNLWAQTRLPLFEHKENGADDHQKSYNIVPPQAFSQIDNGEDCEHNKSDHLLHNLKLGR